MHQIKSFHYSRIVIVIAFFFAVVASAFSYYQGWFLSYGDAESHLNIAKRVTDSLTPGLAQLGGIWLPLPHLLMVPFTNFDFFWRTGLAGAIVSGLAYILASVYVYRLVVFITGNPIAGIIGFLIFALNPNTLYMQSTAMTEMPLIAFYVINVFYFLRFISHPKDVFSLILAALFGLFASLSRYDGWFIVLLESGIIIFMYGLRIIRTKISPATINPKAIWGELEGKLILFSTLSMVGIVLWILWDWLILKDPFYFTNSPFSAKSQQMGWLARGELPSYHDWKASFQYYALTAVANIGYVLSPLIIASVVVYLLDSRQRNRFYVTTLLFSPFLFYVITLYLGQSVIFLPQLTPDTFEWQLFNVRYGIMMLPAAGIYSGYLAHFIHRYLSTVWQKFSPKVSLSYTPIAMGPYVAILVLLFIQLSRFMTKAEPIVTLQDGIEGLSSADTTTAQSWMQENYDNGLILMDDYARTMSVIRSGLPMENVIYIGNKPYWEESLENPEKYARWIVMQKNDTVWNTFLIEENKQAQLYKYFEKTYTSPDILIFKRSDSTLSQNK